ncbi:daptide-type RiPP [Streptomyces sp. NPDC091368]|uniref:daptide-type RiPP n=1 Tax=Streptomyces sp. NPDC091368 TaxID=3365993 RepID=UPI00381EB53E
MANHRLIEQELQELGTELEMQELEPVHAPGWATSVGVSVGISIVSVAWSLT